MPRTALDWLRISSHDHGHGHSHHDGHQHGHHGHTHGVIDPTIATTERGAHESAFRDQEGWWRPTRSDFSITADSSNKQLAFVEDVARALKPGGRAAVVVPDNVLFEDNTGRRLRTWVMDLATSHDPATADRYLLCSGGEDQRPVPVPWDD